MQKPTSQTLGLRHLALFVEDLEACAYFYQELLGMSVDWHPDPDNIYLTSGHDNLALHRGKAPSGQQRLDHMGFLFSKPDDVDEWYEFLVANNVEIVQAPKTHRDDSRSFYCKDPAGNVVQLIYIPSVTA